MDHRNIPVIGDMLAISLIRSIRMPILTYQVRVASLIFEGAVLRWSFSNAFCSLFMFHRCFKHRYKICWQYEKVIVDETSALYHIDGEGQRAGSIQSSGSICEKEERNES